METGLLSQYLQLFHCDWLSPVQFSRHLKRAGTLREFLTASDELLQYGGLTETQIEYVRRVSSSADPAIVNDDLEWAQTAGHEIICFEDIRYPELLRQVDVAPPVLFVRGNIETLLRPQLAIVGSRDATSYGLRNAYWMAHELSVAGMCITSGMARGIDTRAHQGALAAGHATIAIIGTGADVIYPTSNRRLAEQIAETGALVSEFPLGTMPIPFNFPRRNRIMSGLSLGTLVVEATLKSGSLITAKLALEQNREVFAIPGMISNPQSSGCHQLIADGARLVQRPEDILQELGMEELSESPTDNAKTTNADSKNVAGVSQDAAADRLTRLIGYQGCELQYLLDVSGLEYQTLVRRLLELEIVGKIQASGGRYYRA